MRHIAQLLVVVSLAAGALAASTAYHVSLDLPDEQLEGLALNDDAGVEMADDGSRKPLLEKNRRLTRDDLERLRNNRATIDGREVRVRFVRVKEFSFTRWRGKWIFLLSLLGMALGAVLLRRVGLQEAAERFEAHGPATPLHALRTIADTLDEACRQLDETEDPSQQIRLVLEAGDQLQKKDLPAFIEAKSQLIAHFGLGTAAELMDRFALAERQINRAWSAAADHSREEAVSCLQTARRLFGETLAALDRLELKGSSDVKT